MRSASIHGLSASRSVTAIVLDFDEVADDRNAIFEDRNVGVGVIDDVENLQCSGIHSLYRTFDLVA